MASQSAHKELFLDILTKEEREALLNKKLEEIRKKNEAIQKRHQEIEEDKQRAEKTGSAMVPPPVAPARERRERPLPAEERDKRQSWPLPKNSGGGRGKPPGGRGKDKGQRQSQVQHHERSVRWEPSDTNQHGDPSAEGASPPPDPRPQRSRRGRNHFEPFGYAPSEAGLWENKSRPSHYLHDDRGEAEDQPRNQRRGGGRRDRNDFDEAQDSRPRRFQGASADGGALGEGESDQVPRPRRNRRDDGREQQLFRGGRRRLSSEENGDGPPPDPSYNFLSDRRRDFGGKGGDKAERDKERDPRRHPKNFGGQDFSNVKVKMRENRNRQDKERVKSGPPRTKRELEMAMTGHERRQYAEWQAEREKLDKERIDRQKLATGEWRREWDRDKIILDEDDVPRRTEPARRPAGRIGSGRFDHGDREERHRGEASVPKAGGVNIGPDEGKKPLGRGRARGRGRGRGRGGPGGEKVPRPRTHSGSDDGRRVEQQDDSLVVKIDNLSQEPDDSVEVEYWDDAKGPQAAAAAAATPRKPSQGAGRGRSKPAKSEIKKPGKKGQRRSHSPDNGRPSLKLDCKLNPDAPEFTPMSPGGFKTPPGHVKVADWVAEAAANLSSPTSPRSDASYGLTPNDQCPSGYTLSPSSSGGSQTSPTHVPAKASKTSASKKAETEEGPKVAARSPKKTSGGEGPGHKSEPGKDSAEGFKAKEASTQPESPSHKDSSEKSASTEVVETSEAPQNEPPVSSSSGAKDSLIASEKETEHEDDEYEDVEDEEEEEEEEEEEGEEEEEEDEYSLEDEEFEDYIEEEEGTDADLTEVSAPEEQADDQGEEEEDLKEKEENEEKKEVADKEEHKEEKEAEKREEKEEEEEKEDKSEQDGGPTKASEAAPEQSLFEELAAAKEKQEEAEEPKQMASAGDAGVTSSAEEASTDATSQPTQDEAAEEEQPTPQSDEEAGSEGKSSETSPPPSPPAPISSTDQ